MNKIGNRIWFRFAELVNDVFNTVILIQCITSTFILCVTIFIISKSNLTSISEFAYIAAYSACMVFELFLYCWFGNEVIYEVRTNANCRIEGNTEVKTKAKKKCFVRDAKKFLIKFFLWKGKKIFRFFWNFVPIDFSEHWTQVRSESYKYQNSCNMVIKNLEILWKWRIFMKICTKKVSKFLKTNFIVKYTESLGFLNFHNFTVCLATQNEILVPDFIWICKFIKFD